MNTRRSLLAGAGSLLVAACQPGSDLPPVPDYLVDRYELGSGDQIRIITFGEDQLTGDFRVGDDGDIALPLLGNLHVAGLTTEQVDQRIASGLRTRNLIRDPSVSTEVIRYRPIFVLGEVTRPGEYPYQPNMTMLTAVAVAGGFTYRAVESYAEIIRTIGGHNRQPVVGLIRPSSFIAPGDVVKIFMRRF